MLAEKLNPQIFFEALHKIKETTALQLVLFSYDL